MADAIIGSTVQVLLEKVISVASNRIGLVIGFKEELEALQGYAKDIQAVLADAETKQSRNPIVLRWFKKVQGVAFEADSVLDELLYESLRREVESRVKSGAKVCLFFFSVYKHDLSFRWRMGSKVRDINDKLKKFNLEAIASIGLIRVEDSLLPTAATVEETRSRQTDSLPLHFVVGRCKEECKIVEILLLGSSDLNVSILPIVGMGGLGKTTLAKSIYNNSQIDHHFGKKAWICVSDKFEVTEIFRGILESFRGGKVEISGRDAILQQINKDLNGERFLFVFDDVWNEDPELWNDFFSSLVALNPVFGSFCLLTTRLRTTANLVSTVSPFILKKLADDECWSIIGRRATKVGEMPEEFNVHKEQILRRCQGLPLAANVIGGLLSLHKREDWLSIMVNKVLNVSENVDGKIMPILILSYDNLPSPFIKKCFAYCSIFAKDTYLDGAILIQLWMAEGFLQENAERMEEIGANYLRILLQSSLLEEVNQRRRLGGRRYQMHDLVHDLAETVSKQERIDVVKSYQVQHLALKQGSLNEASGWVRIVKGDICNKMVLRFKHLHVLNLAGVEIKSLAPSISKLKHLRYLVLSDYSIRTLPESLCMLYNLQTLRLDGCDRLQCLPQRMSNLISLRHLHFYRENREFQMSPEMGRLTCLQTLKFFNVGEEDGRGIEELGSMNNLKGTLEIRNLELVKGKEGGRLANLFGKQNLTELRLSWGSTVCDDHVLEGLEPHSSLPNLSITNFMGFQLPQWFKKLSVLVKLELNNCKSFTELPALGHLPYLEELIFFNLENVVCIGDSFYNVDDAREGKVFPALIILKLFRMVKLAEWKELKVVNGGSAFPKLEVLDIYDCCELATTPTYFPKLSELSVYGNIQVWVVKNVIGKSASLIKTLRVRRMGGLSSLTDVIENNLTSLEELVIEQCDGLTDIPRSSLECCTSLKSLMVGVCPNLVSCLLDLKQTPSLSSLAFDRCPNLFTTNAAMPRGFNHLINLSSLSIGPFSDDDAAESFDWSGLILGCSSTLRALKLYGSPQRHYLFEQLQHFTSLRYLWLENLESLEVLPDWLGNLTSLYRLDLVEVLKTWWRLQSHLFEQNQNYKGK